MYKLVDFCCDSGGAPANNFVKEVKRGEKSEYQTSLNGVAYSGFTTIKCRNTGKFDRNGLEIYEAENGKLFVFKYEPGTPEYFDSGEILEPELD